MKGRNERITKKQSNNGTVQQKRTDAWMDHGQKKNEMVHVLVISQNQFKVTIGALIVIMFILCSDEKADFILTH